MSAKEKKLESNINYKTAWSIIFNLCLIINSILINKINLKIVFIGLLILEFLHNL